MDAKRSGKTIDCSICKLTFDEDHGVWVCLECTEKLTNAMQHRSSSPPQPPLKLQHTQSNAYLPSGARSPFTTTSNLPRLQSAHSLPPHHRHSSSLPNEYDHDHDPNHAMTLFLELINNGNKRRFKYKPNDIHRGEQLIDIQQHLLKRFSHDVDIKRLLHKNGAQISKLCSFEINDRGHPYQYITFETLSDLFDGAKIRINIDRSYFVKYQLHHHAKGSTTNVHNKKAPAAFGGVSGRRRSKSASSLNEDLSQRSLFQKPPSNLNTQYEDDQKNAEMELRSQLDRLHMSAAEHAEEEQQLNESGKYGQNINLKIKTQILGKEHRVKPKRKNSGNDDDDDIVSPKYLDHKSHLNVAYDMIADKHGGQDSGYDYSFDEQCIIIDNGSGLMKCGFGGFKAESGPHGPHIVFPTAYSHHNRNVEIGQKALEIAEKLNSSSALARPIHRGFVNDWNEMEHVWDNILNQQLQALFSHNRSQSKMEYNLRNHAVLMTDRYQTPHKHREKLLEVMFESFEIPSLYLAHSASLSIYGTGRTKGVVLDIGHGTTTVLAMFDRVALSQNTGSKVVEFGGLDITTEIMNEYKVSYLHATQMKEKFYCIPYERGDILFADQNKAVYKLPDGKEIRLGKDRMMKPLHLLFDKSSDNKYGGINVSELVINCIKSNEIDIQNLLWKNIVLSGGSTMMDGFAEKFAKEIKHLTPVKTQVIAGRSRRYLSWVGAVVMSSISTFKNISISRAMYQEYGSSLCVKELKL